MRVRRPKMERGAVLALVAALAAGCGSSNSTSKTPPGAAGSSSGSMAVLELNGSTYAFVPSATGVSAVKLGSTTVLGALEAPPMALSASASKAIALTPPPDACAADWVNSKVVCASYGSSQISVIDASSPSFPFATYDTGLGTSVSYSGGSCIVCGILYDPTDNRMILATAGGYALFDHLGSHAISRTIPATVAENFGYNPVTNQVFSPQYAGSTPSIDLVDVGSGKVYSLTPAPATLGSPDQGAVDFSTNVAITAEEYSLDSYLVALGTATLDKPAAGQFQALNATIPLTHTQSCSWPLTDIAVDSASHTAFFSAEFCSTGGDMMGAARLPTSAPTSAAALTISDYAFAAIPNPATSVTWTEPGDPHGIANFTLSSGSKHYGLLVNSDKTYVAAVDLDKLLAAPRDASDPHLVSATYDLAANGVVTFFPVP